MPVKSVPIKLDRTRRLCFNFNAFAELQRECGISFFDLQKFADLANVKDLNKPGLLFPAYELRGFIWAGLLDETPEITLKEVGKILDDCLIERADEIGEALATALIDSTFFKDASKKVEGPESKIQNTGETKTISKKVKN